MIDSATIYLPLPILRGSLVDHTRQLRYRHHHSTLAGGMMECLASLFALRNGREIITLTELADNPGPSVTNCAATLLPAVFTDIASVPPEKVTFIEHYRSGLSYPPYAGDDWETWDELQFDTAAGAVIFRCWKRLDQRGKRTA